MSDEAKKIIVDDDWKAQAQREKEQLSEKVDHRPAAGPNDIPPSPFVDLLNLLAMQALVGLGGFASPDGQPIPPDPAAAKHFIDLIHVLDEKTKGNLTADEKKLVDATLYELRMRFVQMATALSGGGPGGMGGGGMGGGSMGAGGFTGSGLGGAT
ncbi:MAG: DUF1844 domain-containing protein [Phycisphaerae bacterium]|nr:DUF1844 domain-containing protein [Phycisphaerae bacterium]